MVLAKTITKYCNKAYILPQAASFGVVVELKEFPYFTAIGWRKENCVNWGCGGSLISLKFIVTAVHCSFKTTLLNNGSRTITVPSKPTVARIGDISVPKFKSRNKQELSQVSFVPLPKVMSEEEFGQEFEIIRIIVHPEYRSSRRYHDIALMELDREADITNYVVPTCLWNRKEMVFTELEAAGYGEIELNGGMSPNLMKIQLIKTDIGECEMLYNATIDRRLSDGLIESQHLCAKGKPDMNMETCQGKTRIV